MSLPDNEADPGAATTRLAIDLDALAENWRTMRDLSGNARCGAAVKANAYGTGAERAAPRLAQAGCKDFFVADANEGANLRPLLPEARIFVLNGVFGGSLGQVLAHDLIPVINSPEQAQFWTGHAGGRDHALHVDTGMNRLGLTPEQAIDHARAGGHAPLLLMSHFACADEPDHPLNARQIEAFAQVRALFSGVDASLANSAGILLDPGAHHELTRPGIALYGANPVNGSDRQMRSVVTAETRILQIRHARAGEPVSYGSAHVLTRDSRIAVCGVGYADGFHRSGSGAGVPLRSAVPNGTFGATDGVRVPVIGKITMDLTMFDVTDLPEGSVSVGDWIEILGPTIHLNEAARAAGTISYELLTSLGHRATRSYKGMAAN